MRTCHYHSDRPALGICMRCRVAICAACCTRVNGVNHCHACLKALGRRPEERQGSAELGTIAAAMLLGMAWLVLLGLCWAMRGPMAP
jgi:hypothetical protein